MIKKADPSKVSFIQSLMNQAYDSPAAINRTVKTGLKNTPDLKSAYDKLFNSFAEQDLTDMDVATDYLNQTKAMFPNEFKAQAEFGAKPFAKGSLKNTMGVLGSNIAAHPMASLGVGALGASNVAGLFDNDKIAGQLVGGAGGALLANKLLAASKINPLAGLAIGLGGGTLGTLFDKLMAKKDEEQQAMQYYQY